MNQHSKLRHMLVVDDDPIIRDMMVDILDFEGYSIRTARNGPEALEMLRGDEDYLVFLDLMMPGMSGKEVCTLLEAEPTLRRRHVIILMSAMDRPDEDTALRVDATILKPFTVNDVLEVVGPYVE
jgi:CheY-like chemotaxis protein